MRSHPDTYLDFLRALNEHGLTYKALDSESGGAYLYFEEEAEDINLHYLPDDPDGNVWAASWVYKDPIGRFSTAKEAADSMWVQYMIRLAERGHDLLESCRRLRGRKRQRYSRALRKVLDEVRRLT